MVYVIALCMHRLCLDKRKKITAVGFSAFYDFFDDRNRYSSG